MIWAMFKVYLNNPNYYVKQEDILANVCGNGSRDVRKIMNSLGIHKGDPSTLTYGQLLKQCNIMNRLRFIKVRDVKSPSRGNDGDAGLDFYIPEDLTLQDLVKANPQLIFHCKPLVPGKVTLEYNSSNQVQVIYISPFTRILIPSGIKGLLEPKDSMLMAANKSGISTKKGLIYTAEIVDSPYTGEIHIGIYNTSREFQIIEAGTKLVQFIHVPIYLTEPEEVTYGEFYNDASTWGTRGNNGFGSTN